MNKVNYDQTEGFPLDVNILDFGQKANQISQQLGEIIAPLAIVLGCIENGNNIGDGVVYIDGELLPFKGGLKQNQLRIVETVESREFENGNSKDVLITRYATFGIGATKSYNWSDLYRLKNLKEIEANIAQRVLTTEFTKLKTRVETLEIYSRPFSNGNGAVLFLRPANEIPEGWEEVTDLRGRMPMGLNPDDSALNSVLNNNTGGSAKKTISKANLPAVGIGYKDAYYIENNGTSSTLGGRIYLNGTYYGSSSSDNNNNYLYYRDAVTDNLGNGETLDVLNPYRIVIFIKPKA